VSQSDPTAAPRLFAAEVRLALRRLARRLAPAAHRHLHSAAPPLSTCVGVPRPTGPLCCTRGASAFPSLPNHPESFRLPLPTHRGEDSKCRSLAKAAPPPALPPASLERP